MSVKLSLTNNSPLFRHHLSTHVTKRKTKNLVNEWPAHRALELPVGSYKRYWYHKKMISNYNFLQIRGSLVRSQLVSLEFFTDIKSFRSHYGPGVDSASKRNEYQEHFLGVKAAGAL